MSEKNKIEYQKIPKLKYWMQEQGLTQDELSKRTHLSVRTVHKLVNTGVANKSIILLVAHELGLKEKELIEMLKTEENKNHFENKKASKKKK